MIHTLRPTRPKPLPLQKQTQFAQPTKPKIVALYKTYDGEEWIEASLASIYPFVDKIVLVHSDTNWSGQQDGNRVAPVVAVWKEKCDIDKKLVELFVSISQQEAQYQIGLTWICNNIPDHIVMLVDSDEIWDSNQLQQAKQLVSTHQTTTVFTCSMRTYVRSPFFLIEPPEPLRPVVFVRNAATFAGVRGGHSTGMAYCMPTFFHHFTAVRLDESAVRRKIERSIIGDHDTCVDINKWYINKFLQLPGATDFHPTAGFERNWHSCRVVSKADLPLVTHNLPIVKKYDTDLYK